MPPRAASRRISRAAHCLGAHRLFAVGANNKKAVVCSTSTGEETATFVAKAGINAVAFAGTGSATRLLTGTFNGQIAMWRVEGGGSTGEQSWAGRVGDGEGDQRELQHAWRLHDSTPGAWCWPTSALVLADDFGESASCETRLNSS